eukprot:TRINITY_DN49887_c0_g1_i1.p1 TRINITY_DN49887_c0_g1~~TRINITY_DN49887_c0_g1_i1.p1  ORF type:complete len:410 (+),score=72.93 TRINITY_DN49887_c0_g1_i1:128-1357(+)
MSKEPPPLWNPGEPYPNGLKVLVDYRDGTKRVAEIIAKKEVDKTKAPPNGYNYYVHYEDFNRRMDQWVAAEKCTPLKDDKSVPFVRVINEKGDIIKTRRRGDGEISEFIEPDHTEHEGMDENSIREHEAVTKVKNVENIELGRFRMDCWYFSPFPKEFWPNESISCLHFCEFCLSFYRFREELLNHLSKCECRNPPGNEVYKDEKISMFEVDGTTEQEYCQNLCYLAKLFLDHKTLYYDVNSFMFYVLCEVDEYGCHPVGYFSKEKLSETGNNLACILTLPCYQRKGYGRFLIDFSYALSKKEKKIGSPEKPLSDLGLLSYRSYWSGVLVELLNECEKTKISIIEISQMTSIKPDDVVATLQYLQLLKYCNGQHIISIPQSLLQEHLKKYPKKKRKSVRQKNLYQISVF